MAKKLKSPMDKLKKKDKASLGKRLAYHNERNKDKDVPLKLRKKTIAEITDKEDEADEQVEAEEKELSDRERAEAYEWGELPADEILKVSLANTNKEIKKYLLSDALADVREELYKYWDYYFDEGDNDCPSNCGSCVTVRTTYLQCFDRLHKASLKQLGIEKDNTPRRSIPLMPQTAEEGDVKELGGKLECDNCYIADRCAHWKVGQVCVYDFSLDMDFTDTKSAYNFLVNAQKERVVRSLHFEKIDGGIADKNVTMEIQILQSLLETLDDRGSIKIKGGIDVQIPNNAQSSGLLSTLFPNLLGGKKEDAKELPENTETKAIEVPAQDAEIVNDSEKVKVEKS